MTIASWIETHARFAPTKVALCFENLAYTYAEFASKIRRTATLLKSDFRISKGDRVAFLGYNTPEFLMVFFACARLGAILVPLNWRLTALEHLYILRNSESKLLFLESEFAPLIEFVQEQLPACEVVGVDFDPASNCANSRAYPSMMARVDDEPRRPDGSLEDPLLIVYTSGTTGYPKGAVLTQNAIFWNALNSIHHLDLTSEDNVLTVAPLFHVGGLNVQTTPAFYIGATVILQRYFHPDQVLLSINNHRPTMTVLVPSMMDAVSRSPLWNKTDFGDLRIVETGSTTVAPNLCDTFRAKGTAVVISYGATETCPLAIYSRRDSDISKVNSVGLAARHCQIRIVDKKGQDCPTGGLGEIWVKGPNVMAGYWKNPEATAEAIQEGWYHTGDIGYCDEDGYYYIADRKKNMIIAGGENVYPAEVERVLLEHPAVDALAVVGIPDDIMQEIPVAVIVSEALKSMDNRKEVEDALNTFLSDKLASYKRPRHFFFVDDLPRTALGKIQHFQVREQLLQDPQFASRTAVRAFARGEYTNAHQKHDWPTPSELRQRLQDESKDGKRRFLQSYLQTQIAGSLGIGTDEIHVETPINQMGFDSFIAIHLHYQIGELGFEIPLTRLLERISICELVDELLDAPSKTPPDSSVPSIGFATAKETSLREIAKHPASFIQQEWYELCEETTPDNTLYGQLIQSFRIRSAVDISALRNALRIVEQRHDALRTTFLKENGHLWQQIHAEAKVDFVSYDAASWSADSLREAITAFTHQHCDPTKDAMIKTRLFTLAQDDHIFIVKVSHLVADGWSLWVLFDELRKLYHALSRGLTPSLASAESHVNFCRWYNEIMQGDIGQKFLSYWREKLIPEYSHVQLPYDRPPSQTDVHVGTVITMPVRPEMAERLRKVAQAEGVTIYAFLLAAFHAVLHSYAHQEDIAVVANFPNRSHAQFYHTVGLISAATVIRTQFSKDHSFQRHLQSVQADLLAALDHQAYPTPLLQAHLDIQRKPTKRLFSSVYFAYMRQHIFPEMADLQAADDAVQIDFGGLCMEAFHGATKYATRGYPLEVQIMDGKHALSGLFIYDAELFADTTIRTMIARFELILAAVVENITVTISELASV